MAKYQGSVAVTGFISPTDTQDTYATHDSILGRGGLREVDTLQLRNDIPDDRRRVGMVVFVIENGHYYALIGDITNLSWKDLGTSLGGVDDVQSQLDDLKDKIDVIDDRVTALEAKPAYNIAASMSSTLEVDEITLIHVIPYDLDAPIQGTCSAYALKPAPAILFINVDGELMGTIAFEYEKNQAVVNLVRETPINKNSILTIVAPDTVTELADIGVHLTFTIREED